MKSATDLLHRTPWWALLAAGLALAVGLAVFVTPVHLIRLPKSGATPEENRAIKREMDLTFSQGAIDLARGIVKEMRDHARDPERRGELDQALQEIEAARESLREAGAEVLRAKREAGEQVSEAVREAERAITDAQRDAERALKDAAVEKDAKKKRIMIMRDPDRPFFQLDLGDKGPRLEAGPELPPELRAEIREKVTSDLWRIGVGAGLILLFIPLFIITVISKFFIDRSRAAQRMAELQRKEAEYHRMSQQVTEAKLSALQAQVEPHFLYNTLASVQALTEVDPQKANEMTGHLIHYLRNALPKMRESVSTVGQEVELVRAYLSILQMRMGKRLAFSVDVPQELMELPFPPLMLPSLVENAIKHGLEPQREGGEVRITAELTPAGRLRMVVADTGRGFAETPGAGVGLANIRERLAALYGDAASLKLEAREPRGVVATLEVPREGARARATAAPPPSAAAATAASLEARSRTQRTLAAMGTAERAWRKGLSFTFVVLVVVAAVAAGLGILGVATGALPVHFSDAPTGSATSALVGTAGIAAAFAVVVLALAIVLAVVYGLGFLFVGIAIFVPLVVLVSLFPVLSPFLLVGLGVWWLVRRNRRKADAGSAV